MTNELKVMQHLEQYGSITGREALVQYGILNIHSIIRNLEKDGLEFDRDKVRIDCNNGMQTTLIRYTLKK